MAQVVYSTDALDNLKRAFEFLHQHDPNAAAAAAACSREAVDTLRNHPLMGRLVEHDLRELVVSYGKTGYVALYRFLPALDRVQILALRRQRELDYPR